MLSFKIKINQYNLIMNVTISDSQCSLYHGNSSVHTHHSFEFHYVKSGELEFDINNEKILSEPGKIYLISPYTYHSVHQLTENVNKLSIILKLEENRNCTPCRDLFSYYNSIYSGASGIEVIENCRPYCDDLFECVESFVKRGSLDYELFESLFIVIFKKMAGVISGADMFFSTYSKDELLIDSADVSRAMAAETFIRENYRSDITVAQLAESLHLSVRQTNRFLKNYMNISFVDFIRRYRIEVAKKLLEIPGKSVAEIACEVGYGSYNGFLSAFREVTGKTPSEYMCVDD